MNILVLLVLLALVVLVIKGIRNRRREATSIQMAPPAPQAPREEVWEFAGIYRKREFLFDSASEFNFFKLLTELYSDRFYIFPQVNLSHMVEPKNMPFAEYMRYRSRIDKKSVDFVFCDKVRVVPQLLIELDGYSHGRADRQERDVFVNELMKSCGLPILRLKVGNLNRESLKNEIDRMLARQ
ncbi:MAG: DUF2726 domain-containing protein [Candidatus Uhrbacteria bacterium]|nr:DUF2726 domain-containing protein [Candidatus Uhrbacteria bacterium]